MVFRATVESPTSPAAPSAAEQRLSFQLLSDFNKTVIRRYGVFNEDMLGLNGIARRAVIVIDKTGAVRYREVLENAGNEPDYERLKKALAQLGR